MRHTTTLIAAATLGLSLCAALPSARAEDKVLVRIDGLEIKESDVKLAETEIGPEVGNMPEAERKRALVEYLIDNRLMSAAGEKAALGSGAEFEARLAYYRARALRDAFFDANVRNAINDVEAKKFYDAEIGKVPPQEEMRARHILVEKKEEAEAILAQLKGGGDFAAIAKEKSKDPGSGQNGGDLGFFAKGQMVKPFEDALLALKPGEISQPVESQFGWHVIKLEEKRNRPLPEFEAVKAQILTVLLQKRIRDVIGGLRQGAKIEVVDEELKKIGVGAAPTGEGEGSGGQ